VCRDVYALCVCWPCTRIATSNAGASCVRAQFDSNAAYPQMEPLAELMAQVPKTAAYSTLCASFRSLSTSGLPNTALEQEVLDLDALETHAAYDTELTAIGARQDTLAVLSALKAVATDLNLSRFDGVIICRRGSVVVAVRLQHNDCGLCARLDMDDYRQQLAQQVASATFAWHTLVPLALVLSVCLFVAPVWRQASRA
jgi:hypothetical protein